MEVIVPGIRISEAAVCVGCDLVMRLAQRACPGCGSPNITSLSKWLNREKS